MLRRDDFRFRSMVRRRRSMPRALKLETLEEAEVILIVPCGRYESRRSSRWGSASGPYTEPSPSV